MNREKCAFVTLNTAAMRKALEIKKLLALDFDADVFSLRKYCADGAHPIDLPLTECVGFLFQQYKTILFMCASGIVIRGIAPHLKNKAIDPAVLLIDSNAQYVVPLLSGHLGGANEKALLISGKIGAQAVITTATDLAHSLAVDLIAKKKNLVIEDMAKAKEVTALILSGKPVGIINVAQTDLSDIILPENVFLTGLDDVCEMEGLIEITNCDKGIPHPCNARLIRKNMIVGIGCRKGMEEKTITAQLLALLAAYGISKDAVRCFATVPAKENEQGILEAAARFDAKVEIVPYKEIKKVQGLFAISEFVEKTLGIGCVAEPCGYIASGRGKGNRISEKAAENGTTFCLWEEE